MDAADLAEDHLEQIEALRRKYQPVPVIETSDYCMNCLLFTGGSRWCNASCQFDYQLRMDRGKV